MSERIRVPIKYVGEVGENSFILNTDTLPGTIEVLSREALDRIKFFNSCSQDKQAVAIKALSILGLYTISLCEGKWNSSRWAEVWEDLNFQAQPIIDLGSRETTELTIRQGFKNLFQMLETGANSMEALSNKKRLNKQEISSSSGKVSHTRQASGTKHGTWVK